MALLCGVVALDPRQEIPGPWKTWLLSQISRKGIGGTCCLDRQGIFVLSLDLGTYAAPAWKFDEVSGLVAMAGDSVFRNRPVGRSRDWDLQSLAASSPCRIGDALRASRGIFSAVRYTPSNHEFALATDRLGGRPLYWLRSGNMVLFATAKRLLCGVPGIDLSADARGMLEVVVLGHALRDRTEFSGLMSMDAGHWMLLRDGVFSVTAYWDWSKELGPPEPETPAIRRDLYNEFRSAVALRLGSRKDVFAGLSSGLDSRCVVTVLKDLGAAVHTVNVSWAGSLDQLVARQYAKALGSVHHESELGEHEVGTGVADRCWQIMREHSASQLWGGNDGSISVGYVYVSPASVAAQREGRIRDVAQLFVDELVLGLSPHGLSASLAQGARNFPVATVYDEIKQYEVRDPGLRLMLFLLLNRQRRTLHSLYEEIDIRPYECVEPFFDSDFLTMAGRLPIDECIAHGLFHRWLSEFPSVLTTVPWQTYPGHLPCPLAMPEFGTSQWRVFDERVAPQLRRRNLDAVDELLAGRQFLSAALNRHVLTLLRLGNRLNLVDGTLPFRQAVRIASILRATDGRLTGTQQLAELVANA